MRRLEVFTTLRTEGGLLPGDLLQRIAAGDKEIEGIDPESFHLGVGERVNEAVSRSWNRLQAAWSGFSTAKERLSQADPGTSLTRERWLLILFQELGYGRLDTMRGVEIGGKTYPISHFRHKSPFHLVGFRIDLDRRTHGVAGAARASPHSLVQEFLNRSEDHLWGFLSNGLRLRILRDNSSLTRQAFVEFDLEGMMEGEVYADFALLWLLCHQSRVETERLEECWLERWTRVAQERGTRALERLREGVEQAIKALGRGFLEHPANSRLRERLRSGALSRQDYYRQLLRLVYRLIFLFAAEDRGILLSPDAGKAHQERFIRFYSSSRLRSIAAVRRGTNHADLYCGLRVVMEKLGSAEGCPALGLPSLGSFLWSRGAAPDLVESEIANRCLLDAVRALSLTLHEKVYRSIDYRNLGAEELGSVYESLLELHPELDVDAKTFDLRVAAGHERKTTGSYYTPSSLVQCLLDSALDPLLEEAARKPAANEAEAAILSLKVCDPACGSGHFLIAAAHRMARRLAAVRSGEEEPSPGYLRQALRDVIGHCIYGVDLNPMAVELCKVSLWMEALEPGKPLSFLDHRIQCGNSLLGAMPALMEKGIPDEAFKPIEGDDKAVMNALRKRNRDERNAQMTLFLEYAAEPAAVYGTLSERILGIDAMEDESIDLVREKEGEYRRLSESPVYRNARLAADAWCAAFVWRKTKDGPLAVTEQVYRRLRENPAAVPASVLEEIERLREAYGFFHWHVAFPDVFLLPGAGKEPENREAGWSGGFDVVLGNPPWERIKLQEKEFFAERHSGIVSAKNAAERRRMISALKEEDPSLYCAFLQEKRKAEGESAIVRETLRFPLCGRGDVNTYAVFAELKRSLISPTGRVGTIVPSGIATDDTTKFFFQELMKERSLVSLYDFENRRKLFPEVDSRIKFSLLTLTGKSRPSRKGADFFFFSLGTSDLSDKDRHFSLTGEEIALLNPNTRTCPIFRCTRDAEITKAVYKRVPVLIREGSPSENPWGMSFLRMIDMANDSRLFRTRDQLEEEGWTLSNNFFIKGKDRFLPLYEAKMIHHFDHRFGDYADLPAGSKSTQLPEVKVERLNDPAYSPLPRYWVPEAEVEARLKGKWNRGWLLGWRDICRSTDERTVIASVVPRVGVGNKIPLMLIANNYSQFAPFLVCNLSTLPYDFTSRQKIGGTTLNFFIYKQLPVLPPATYTQPAPWVKEQALSAWLLPRVLELTYTAWDLGPFAKDCGYEGPPFRWDEERRFLIRCELDAAFFHLYGIERDDADYILETFPIVKRKDENAFGEYRTKRVILEIYDEMVEAARKGLSYSTRLEPVPGSPRAARPAGE